ncbi:MAG: class I SAM-dependent methyltransferase [Phycisphaerales bacterium]|nr:class I SAM-dependent methyltransferase [Phycisphaerales bacterium]
MGRSLAEQSSASVDAPAALFPWLGALFEGVDALGGFPVRAANMLARLGVGRGGRVIDLGCGKGAAAVAIARRCGCRVLGVDACPAFVESARRLAAARGVSPLVRFEVGDFRRLRVPRRFDAAVMLGCDPLDRAAERLRGLVRRGGVYVADDALAPDPRSPYSARAAAAFIASLGDRVEAIATVPGPVLARAVSRTLAAVRANGARLSAERPELRRAVGAFLRAQDRSARELLTRWRAAIVGVRRGP